MTLPDSAERAFDAHEAFVRDADGYELTTTRFDGRVTAEETEEWAHRYTLSVRAPMLSAAVEGEVGPDLESGWFDTFALRLEDAPGAVRESVELETLDVRREAGHAVAEFVFEWGNADRAPAVAKALGEYVEGTYMEGVVPGFDYREPVASMLSTASQGEGTGTPL
ncbi:DUF5813 family protein [Halosegnis marinus]|uniref:DUF5813 family protein n=1 Tax=Halosegnis marinus TaxID=3034023 RepID=A0ABD5ZM30_9EURY|nr:DUF5813 family protein [Halosegnis sp. DT85]